jgi:hypothetical protein
MLKYYKNISELMRHGIRRFFSIKGKSILHNIKRQGHAVLSVCAAGIKKISRVNAAAGAFYGLTAIAFAGPVFFQAASVTASVLQDGYNMVIDAVSNLVFGPYGWLQTIVFLVFGASVLCLDIVLLARLRVKNLTGPILLALLGIGFFIVGLNPAQAPGTPATISTHAHTFATAAVVVLFPSVCFFLAPTFKTMGYGVLYRATLILGIFMSVFMVVGGFTLALHFSMPGIYERTLLWSGQLWMMAICLQLFLDRKLRPAAQPLLVDN